LSDAFPYQILAVVRRFAFHNLLLANTALADRTAEHRIPAAGILEVDIPAVDALEMDAFELDVPEVDILEMDFRANFVAEIQGCNLSEDSAADRPVGVQGFVEEQERPEKPSVRYCACYAESGKAPDSPGN